MRRLRLAFMGTPAFAVPALEAILAAGHEVAAVYSQPPRPSGRGHKIQPSPVHALAERNGISVLTPKSLKPVERQAEFAALKLDVAVIAAYGLILPQPILDAPAQGCINIHASLLPRWRGAAPIQRAILAGDSETGITIMQMDAGLDTGAMLLQEKIPIKAVTTAASLHDDLGAMGARMIVDVLARLPLAPQPQPVQGITYAQKLAKDEGRIEWAKTAQDIDRMVRGLNPWPGVWFEAGGERIKIRSVALTDSATQAAPGILLDESCTIACGAGSALRLLEVQREGRGAVSGDAFLRGFAHRVGAPLG